MPKWTHYVSVFPEAAQDAATALQTSYSNNFGISTFSDFATETQSQIRTDLLTLSSSDGFITALADYLLAEAAESGATDWSGFEAEFSAPDLAWVEAFSNWNQDEETSFATFKASSSENEAANIVTAGGSSRDLWQPYAEMLVTRAEQVLHDPWLNYSDTFPAFEADEADELVANMQETGNVQSYWEFAELGPTGIKDKIVGFATSNTFESALTDTFADKADEVWAALSPNAPSPSPEYFEEYISAFPASKQPAVRQFIENIKDGGVIDNLQELAATHKGQLAQYFDPVPATPTFYELLAQYYDGKIGLALQKTSTSRRFVGQLERSDDGTKLSGYRVKATDTEYTGINRELGISFSQSNGYFEVSYLTYGVHSTYDLRFSILPPHDSTEIQINISPDPSSSAITAVQILPPAETSTSSTISALTTEISLTLSTNLSTYLSNKSITTLEGIRQLGGLQYQSDLTVSATADEVLRLDGHAQLELISGDISNNDTLFDRGYSNLGQVSRAERVGFVSENEDLFGDYRTAQIHATATASQKLLTGLIGTTAAHRGDSFSNTVMDAALPNSCDCPDCQSGVSPLAYLADLINYSLTHVQDSGSAINLSFLQNTFHQPYADLTTSCSSSEDKVCQVRIATEVLRSYTSGITGSRTQAQIDKLASEEGSYLLNSYQQLLTGIGTDYEEIRLARSAAAEDREALADRLGITLTSSANPDELEQLFLDPASNQVTEAALEGLFGLRDTNRDPVTDTPESDLETWRKAKLREVWQVIDFQEDDYEAGNKPLIDPDVIGPDDFRDPSSGAGTPFQLWLDRRTWVDELIFDGSNGGFSEQTKTRGIYLGANIFELADEDRTAYIANSAQLTVANSTGNNGTYTVSHVRLKDSHTQLTVDTAIPNAIADGDLSFEMELPVAGFSSGGDEIILTGEDLTRDFVNTPKVTSVTISNSSDAANDITYTVANIAAAAYYSNGQMHIVLDSGNLVSNPAATGGEITYTKVISLEGESVPDLAAMYGKMENGTAQFTYDAVSVTPWAGTKLSADFASLASDLALGLNVDQVETDLWTDLALTVDSFSRLYELQVKDQKANNNPEFERLSGEEWQEVYAILSQCVKNRYSANWITEEQGAGFNLNPKDFWVALTEPVRGIWPPLERDSSDTILIDPEVYEPKQLPDHPVDGLDALSVYETRKSQLAGYYTDLKSEYESNGFEAMLKEALGDPNPGDALPHNLDDLLDDLDGTDVADAAQAQSDIETTLYMTVEVFRRIMEIREKDADPDPSQKPSTEEMAEVYRYLVTAEKEKRLVPTWTRHAYQNALKATLPQWRAEALDRALWQIALGQRSAAPLIDPDLIGPGDLVDPATGDDAYDLWAARRTWVDTVLSDLDTDRQAEATDQDGIETIITQTLGLDLSSYNDFATQNAAGEDIRSALAQQNLSRAAWQVLEEVYALAKNTQTILDEEWDEVYAILAQVQKEREFAAWRRAEEAKPIHLGPDWFKLLDPPQLSFSPELPHPLPKWLGNEKARRKWQRALENRIDNEAGITEGIKGLTKSVTEQMLPKLRDSLIRYTGAATDSLSSRRKALTDELLLDLKNNCCQGVTRVSMAIETLQSLLWSLRTAQLNDTYPDLDLVASSFDEEWKWLGSYANWRSAMFVFLYPENILLPSLNRNSSPAFRKLTSDLRGNRRLTPEAACRMAKDYSDYLRDVSNLEVKATVQTLTRISEDSCEQSPLFGCLMHMFGVSSETGKLYWSSYDPQDQSDKAQKFWQEVPGFEEIESLCGAMAFQTSASERYIFLFAKVLEEETQKLLFTRYNLNDLFWDAEPSELEIPEEAENFHAVVMQTEREDEPPKVAIEMNKARILTRSMAENGKDWGDEEWTNHLSIKSKSDRIVSLDAFVQNSVGDQVVITTTESPQGLGIPPLRATKFRVLGSKDDGVFKSVVNLDSFKGATFWQGTADIVVWYEHLGSTQYRIIRPVNPVSNPSQYTQVISSLSQLDQFLKDVAGIDLDSFAASLVTNSTSAISFLDLLGTQTANTQIDYSFTISKFFVDRANENDPEILTANEIIKSVTASSDQLWEMILKVTAGTPVMVNIDRSSLGPIWEIKIGNSAINNLKSFATISGEIFGPVGARAYVYNLQTGSGSNWLTLLDRDSSTNELTLPGTPNRLAPQLAGDYGIPVGLDENQLQTRKTQLEIHLLNNSGYRPHIQQYLWEAWYFVPMSLGIQLSRRGEYIRALDWFRTVYDYSQGTADRKIFYGLKEEESWAYSFKRATDWLDDPLDPHAVAKSRANTYTRFTLLSLVRCILDYADSQFTMDTAETVPKARILYETALELLDLLKKGATACENIIGTLNIEISDPYWNSVWTGILKDLKQIKNPTTLQTLVDDIDSAMSGAGTEAAGVQQSRGLTDTALGSLPAADDFATKLASGRASLDEASFKMMADGSLLQGLGEVESNSFEEFEKAIWLVTGYDRSELRSGNVGLPWLGGSASAETGTQDANTSGLRQNDPFQTTVTGSLANLAAQDPDKALQILGYSGSKYTPGNLLTFCIPVNPVLEGLCLRALLNLYKIHNCLNIAGVKREIEPYAAATDAVSGLPSIGAGGQLVLAGNRTFRPTGYRYQVLAERAKQLVGLAQQIEAAFLSTLEKRDAEAYSRLKAQQDLELSKATLRLQDLRVKEAEGNVELAELQKDRVEFTELHFDELISNGWLGAEERSLAFIKQAADLGRIATITSLAQSLDFTAMLSPSALLNNISNTTQAIASIRTSYANYLAQLASYERRAQDWRFQRDLARQDLAISDQQIALANDRVRIVGQEREISELQSEHAKATVDFLQNKFTNVELYDWMSGILEGIYAYFLREATAMAKLAESQLAFERQETPPPYIQQDYWEVPSEDAIGDPNATGVDRRGLTGSARLLRDLYQLDQYAFETDQRRQQLTRTFSLAQLAPMEFQQLRETGSMPFATPMELFDRDFPGHYLRLIKRVRTTVVALVPPIEGIKATLTHNGLSRVTVGGDLFQTVLLRRDPEQIALSSPYNATGLFELQTDGRFLNPFEGNGVDSVWEFRMEKAANRFDYDTLADVLITIEYEALNDFSYRQQVVQRLGTEFSGDRPYSFKNNFADQWYDLQNPDLTPTPMSVRFRTDRADFPANLEEVSLKHIVLYFVRKDGFTSEIQVDSLNFSPDPQNGGTSATLGGAAQTLDGVISTRRSNGSSLLAITNQQNGSLNGEWELKLPDTPAVRAWFDEEQIEDIIFVLTYEGETPKWI